MNEWSFSCLNKRCLKKHLKQQRKVDMMEYVFVFEYVGILHINIDHKRASFNQEGPHFKMTLEIYWQTERQWNRQEDANDAN